MTSLAKPHFAWPAPVAVHVVERKLLGESDSLMSYSLEACPRTDGRLVVAHRDFKLERPMQGPVVARFATLAEKHLAFRGEDGDD